MTYFYWALRYWLQIVRQSILIPIFIGLQAFLLLGMSQGKEVLQIVSSSDVLGYQTIAFAFTQIFLGLSYFSGVYWLLFFSDGRPRLFEESQQYTDQKTKIQAGFYHDFIQANRLYWLRLYSGFCLFSPFFILLFSGLVLKDCGPGWYFSLVFSLIINLIILFLRKKRKNWVVNFLRNSLENLNRVFEFLALQNWRFWGFWFRIRREEKSESLGNWPITTEQKSTQFRNLKAVYRGAFFLQLLFALGLCLATFSIPDSDLPNLGPLAIMQIGLIFWVALLLLFGFLNKVFVFPFRLLLLVWVLAISFLNSDHPTRLLPENEDVKPEMYPSPTHYFEAWMESRKGFRSISKDSFQLGDQCYSKNQPFVYYLVQAEGGANRSGAWTSLVLDSLRNQNPQNFDQRAFAISSVSGGSAGSLVFASKVNQESKKPVSSLFCQDYLSSLSRSLFLGEPFLWLFPIYISEFDRAIGFEKSWDIQLEKFLGKSPELPVNQVLDNKNSAFKPLLLVHATEVESGQKAVLTFPKTHLKGHQSTLPPLVEERMRLSGALHFGARFPLVSPSAALPFGGGKIRHFVDGGYYDNGANETGLELIQAIEKSDFGHMVKPCIIAISNSYETSEAFPMALENPKLEKEKGASFLNEIQSIFTTALKTRKGHTESQKLKLKEHVQKMSGHSAFVEFDLKSTADQVSMNWFLSISSLQHIQKRLGQEMARNQSSLLELENKSNGNCKVKKQELSFSNEILGKDSMVHPLKPLQKTPEKINPKTHPWLYYFSKSQKKWKLKAEADFDVAKLKPLKKRKKK